jgi:hypothetical protein
MRLVKHINDIANFYDVSFSETQNIYETYIKKSFTRYIQKNNPDYIFGLSNFLTNNIRKECLEKTNRYFRRYK